MMVNSLERLFAEIIDSLDQIGGKLADPFARTQVSAIMDLLTNLAPRLEWNRANLMRSVSELRGLFAEIVRRLDAAESYPPSLQDLHRKLRKSIDSPIGENLLQERETRNRLLIEVMETIAAVRPQPQVLIDIQQQCDAMLRIQLDHGLELIKRPLFRRMSQS